MPLSSRVHRGHVVTAAFGIVMMGVVTLGLIAGFPLPVLGGVGVFSLSAALLYLVGVHLVAADERRGMMEQSVPARTEARAGPRGAVTTYVLFGPNAAVIVAAATYLPSVAAGLAETVGIGQSVVGTTLVAMTTSLPEIVVSLAAFRLGAVDMAVGNLLGSNLFNVVILGLDDVLYLEGPILRAVDDVHAIPAVGTMLMTAVAIVGLTYRTERNSFRLGWDALAMVAVYAATVASMWKAA